MLFYLFSFLIVLAALGVVLLKNPVHSTLCLICVFINTAFLFILLGAEFMAMMMIIVYVGAVAVLFLFVIMMLDIEYEVLKTDYSKSVILTTFCAFSLFAAMIIQMITRDIKPNNVTSIGSKTVLTNTEIISQVLYSDYIICFELVGIILLTSILGAISLTTRNINNAKKQNPYLQTTRSKDSVRLVNIKTNSGLDDIDYGV